VDEVRFECRGETLAGSLFAAESDELADCRGRPAVILAHGMGVTRDSMLSQYAERFAAAGIEALTFDYRGCGDSSGEPRDLVDWRRQREDYAAALGYVGSLAQTDGTRVALWGTSFSAGHALATAVDDRRVAAVIAQTPFFDGLATQLATARYSSPAAAFGVFARAIADALRGRAGLSPAYIPIAGPPRSVAALSTPDALAGLRAIAGSAFPNRCCARSLLGIAANRPLRHADGLTCPILIQIADRDLVTPARPAEKVAWAAAGLSELRRYPGGHFDVYHGELFARMVEHQLHFLRRRLGTSQKSSRTAGSNAAEAAIAVAG
jgi:pimeloyl-ACP methyl ester carboxylesterase